MNLNPNEAWKELAGIDSRDGRTITLLGKDRKATTLELSPDGTEAFLRELFKTWFQHQPGEARKAAFDYFSEEKTFKRILLFLSLFILGGISLIFLTDGLHNLHCNRLLEDASQTQVTRSTISKIKKNRRGNFVWDLEFQGVDGKLVHGRRTPVNPQALSGEAPSGTTPAPGTSATVIQSNVDPACWDLSLVDGQNVPPKAQRWFTTNYTLGFGGFFGAACLVLTPLIWRRLRRKLPYRDVVERIYHSL